MKWTSRQKNECIWGWAFILPTMIGLIVLNIYPIFKTIIESFTKQETSVEEIPLSDCKLSEDFRRPGNLAGAAEHL